MSELETPKLTPRPKLDVHKSMEGIPDLPDHDVESSRQTPAGGDKSEKSDRSAEAPAEKSKAPAASGIVMSQSYSARSQSEQGLSNMYSDDFGSVSESVSKQTPVSYVSSRSDRGEIVHLSEPDLSAISSTDSETRRQSELNNVRSLSELDSPEGGSVGTRDDYTADFED